MSDQSPVIELPALHEHTFQSSVPLVGPIIRALRRVLYRLTARWGVLAVIGQQTHINDMIAAYLRGHEQGLHGTSRDIQQLQSLLQQYEARLQEYEARLQEYEMRLIDQDRDLAQLARTLAEVDLRQHHHVHVTHAEQA